MPDTMFLPGFVNAHCHMDLSHLRNKVPFTGSFADWIRQVVSMRAYLTEDDVVDAARELQQSGVTTIWDHVGAFSELSCIMDTPFRKRLYMEVIGVAPDAAAENCQRQVERALIAQREGIAASPTPHATYSVHPEVFARVIANPNGVKQSQPVASPMKSGAAIPLDRHGPQSGPRDDILSIHCAESTEEWELFTEGRGKLWEFVRERGHIPLLCKEGSGEVEHSTPSDSPLQRGSASSPLHYLADHNLLPTRPWLAVHCNTLTDDDIVLLKKSQATVVHCPRSHRFFSHPPFPLEKLRAAGVPIAIGTDSLASCPNFDFLAELRAMREEFPFLSTEEILKMATQRDTLTPSDTDDIIGLLLQDDILKGPVTFSRIGGKRVI